MSDRGSMLDDRGSAPKPTEEPAFQPPGDAGPRPPSRDTRSSTGLDPRTASALAYLAGPFSGLLVLWAETTNRDVRFHAWQSIFGLGGLVLAIVLSGALALVALFVSATGLLVMLRVATAIAIVLVVVWAICLWKAFTGGRWKLPLAGNFAERRVAPRR